MSSFTEPAATASSAGSRPAATEGASPVPAKLSRGEITVIILTLAALAFLRWFSVYCHKWNSDEPQHLHVVWAWTVGKLQYRDVFDNHTPLFHMLNAPLLRWLGERADIVQPMRQAMMPLFALGMWCVYRLGAGLFDRRTGWFAALLAALLPAFYFRMGEFRTDVLWTSVWLLSLVVAVGGRPTPWRTFGATLLLGAAFMVSMKTTLLTLCVVVAGIITWLLAGRPLSKRLPAHVLAALGGLVIVPGIIIGYFASQGALKPFYHCVIEHNTLPGENIGRMILRQFLAKSTLWLIPVWFCTARMLPGVRQEPDRGYRRLFLFLVTGLFYPLLRIFWPVVTTQDYLPWLPLVPIFAVAGSTWTRDWLDRRFPSNVPWLLLWIPIVAALLFWGFTRDLLPDEDATKRSLVSIVLSPLVEISSAELAAKRNATLVALVPIYLVGAFGWFLRWRQTRGPTRVAWLLVPTLLLAGEIAYILTDEPLFAQAEQRRIGHLAAALRLVDPGEYVLDTKGETIFRPRPTYLVLETLTIRQIKSGRIQDDIIPRLIETRTAFVRASNRMMPSTQNFISKNYVHVDGGRVLGKRVAAAPNVATEFEITIPERYSIITPSGPVEGTIDGQPIDGPVWLEAGRHKIVSRDAAGQVVVIWARALERGFSPYNTTETQSGD
jgi:hypothetical protein